MARPFEIDREDLRVKMLEYLDSDGYKTITAFCVKYRISRRYLYKLFEDHEELKHIGEQITLTREQALEVGGLSGELNAGMAKFALNQLGWSEKQDVNQNVKADVKNTVDPGKLTDEELRQLIELQRKSGTSKEEL